MGHIFQSGFQLGCAQDYAMAGEFGAGYVDSAVRSLGLANSDIARGFIDQFKEISRLWASQKDRLPEVFRELQEALPNREYQSLSAGYILGTMRHADKVGKSQGLAVKTVVTRLLKGDVFMVNLDLHLRGLQITGIVQRERNMFYNKIGASQRQRYGSSVVIT